MLRLFLTLLAILITAPSTHTAPLFNGTTLEGWYSYLVDTKYSDPRNVFAVTNNTIRISGEGLGYLATKAHFANYHLSLEFKWGTTNHHWGDRIGKARDSGIFLHATGPDGNSDDGNGAFMACLCLLFRASVGPAPG